MSYVYMVRCADGTLYTGYAVDVDRRLAAHNAGRGARYTAGRRPVQLVFMEVCASRSAAQRREHQVKRLSRRAKEGLILAAAPAAPAAAAAAGGETRRPRRRLPVSRSSS